MDILFYSTNVINLRHLTSHTMQCGPASPQHRDHIVTIQISVTSLPLNRLTNNIKAFYLSEQELFFEWYIT